MLNACTPEIKTPHSILPKGHKMTHSLSRQMLLYSREGDQYRCHWQRWDIYGAKWCLKCYEAIVKYLW